MLGGEGRVPNRHTRERRKTLKKIIAFCLMLAMGLTVVSGCTDSTSVDSPSTNSAEEANAGEQDAIVVIQKSEPSTLDPCFSGAICESNIMDLIFDTFTTFDENNEIVGNVAESWKVSDDGLTWTFNLRDDIYFPDGEQLTADDVKYTFDRTTDPDTMATGNYLWVLDGISYESCNVVSDFVVEIVTSIPCPIITTYLADVFIIPEHYYRSLDTTKSQTQPMGSGPYQLESWDTANSIITLKKNPDYWGIDAGVCTGDIETFIWKTGSEDSSRVAEMVAGGADLITDVPVDMSSQIENSGIATYSCTEGSRRLYFGFTLYNQEFTNEVAFRQAMNYAFDADSCIDTLWGGVGTRTASYTNNPWADPDCEPYPYDPEKAKELLDSIGMSDTDGDGWREWKGEKVTLKVGSCGNYSKEDEIAQAFVQNLIDIGLDAVAQTYDAATYSSAKSEKTLDCDLFFNGSGSVMEVQTDLTDFLSGNEANYCGWANEEFDAKMAELSTAFDYDDRMQLGYEAQEIMREDAPIVFFSMANLSYGISHKLDWTPTQNGRINLKNATYIYE